jgi:membrane-associated protein
MDQLIEIVNSNIQYAHLIMFFSLLLAGFNLPVSEDAMIFIAALLSIQHPEYQSKLILWVFAGCYLSDLICYGFVGRYLGPKLFKIKFFSKMVSQEKLDKIAGYYEKYGVLTLIFGRFIPFGVRNALFISAGIAKMKPGKFALSDLLACAISFTFFYTIYFTYGKAVIEWVQAGNIAIFSIFLTIVLAVLIRNKNRPRNNDT